MLSHEFLEPLTKLTYEEERLHVDEELYGVADDPSVPYPWEEPKRIIQEPIVPNTLDPTS